MSNPSTVYVVHTIDTEGPLYESLEAKFIRLNDLFGIRDIEPTKDNIEKLKLMKIPLGGIEKEVAAILNGHLAEYNETWDKIDAMLDKIMSKSYREQFLDSFGEGWVFNWHCLDHVGYEYNPRRRDMGYHNIFDFYVERIGQYKDCPDAIHWHFHPMSTYREAHRCATSYENSTELHPVICRKIIERNWFPTVFRAGFQTERPDSHWFLEQWIPFDISNMALDDNSELDKTIDFRNGRSGDWRLAPSDWSLYHPSHDNYQLPGDCRRWIGRALNVLNRLASIDQYEMDKAFARANEGLPTVVGIASHDFRDLSTEVDFLRDLVKCSSDKYPNVKFKFSEAVEAFQSVIWPDEKLGSELELDVCFHAESDRDVAYIEVRAVKGTVFGPQPYLAIETQSKRFIHDNFDFDIEGKRWFYAFHADTLPLSDVANLGIASNDKYGNRSIVNLKNVNGRLVKR